MQITDNASVYDQMIDAYSRRLIKSHHNQTSPIKETI
jgi:hypothetical protein